MNRLNSPTAKAIEDLDKLYEPWLSKMADFPEFVEFQKSIRNLLVDSWKRIDELYKELESRR